MFPHIILIISGCEYKTKLNKILLTEWPISHQDSQNLLATKPTYRQKENLSVYGTLQRH